MKAATGSGHTMQTFHHVSGPGQSGTYFPQAADRPALKEGHGRAASGQGFLQVRMFYNDNRMVRQGFVL